MTADVYPANGELSTVIAIVNYRTPELTVDCLESLSAELKSLPDVKVVVSDNNSGDHSVAYISQAIADQGWEDWATFMPLPHNGGFAYGNNEILRSVLAAAHQPNYVLLLNPDTVVRSGAIANLIKFMDQHPEVGIAGSRLEDPDGTPQRSAFRFHTVFSELDDGLKLGLVSKLLAAWVVAPPVSDQAFQTQWVAGASMIIRHQVIEDIGLMDEAYFMYYEEMDYCLQAKRAGWPCWYVPNSRVVHLVGQSSGVTNTKLPPKRRPQYYFDSRRRYFLKNYGWLYLVIADLAWSLGFSIWQLRRRVQRKPDNHPPQLLYDFVRNSVLFRGIPFRTAGKAQG